MNKDEIISYFLSIHDESLRKFNKKLVQTNAQIIGNKVSEIKKIAKLEKDNADELINSIDDTEYLELDLLKGLLISYQKNDILDKLEKLEKFSKNVDNWAVCDTTVMSTKFKNKDYPVLFAWCKKMLKKEGIFEKRFAVIFLIKYFSKDDPNNIFSDILNCEFGEYYFDMAVSWYFATCLIYYFDEVLLLLQTIRNKSEFVYQKSLQKAIESFRITVEQKIILKKYKKGGYKMLDFEFCSPTKIYFGDRKEREVGEIIKSYGFRKVLFHYGKNSIKEIGLYDKVISSFKKAKLEFVELGNVEANPKLSLVKKGIELAKKEEVDFILAVGGGSVIDSAKAIACGVYLDCDPWLLNSHEVTPTKAFPIGTILTISAAGSELSNSCVITNDETNVKSGFNSDLIRPLFSILNPKLTYSVSKYQTACGIVDILMHTVERYLTDKGNNEFAMNIGEGLLKAVIDAGRVAIKDPTDYEARSTLMIASSFSHNGLTGLGSKMYFTVHKLEHEITGMFDNVAHGAGLSVLFIAWAKYVFMDSIYLFSRLGYNVFNIDKSKDEKTAAFLTIFHFETYFKELGMPTTLEELNIDESKLEFLADRITKGDTVELPGIRNLNKNDIMNIFNLAKGGKLNG